MKATELSISGVWEFLPQRFDDDRGSFHVWYDVAVFADALGFELSVKQTNNSVSRRGVVRGLHWADVPPGQAKYVYCPRGALLDIIVDLRVGSRTFGQHEIVRLDSVEYRALYIAEGLGHGFLALEDDTVMSYLCSERYAPAREHIVNVYDEDLALPLPADVTPVRSDRDAAGLGLAELQAAGRLPDLAECEAYYRSLRAGRRA
jgi:dTDP-4-dehydrorhamnose 3,5-epimerase